MRLFRFLLAISLLFVTEPAFSAKKKRASLPKKKIEKVDSRPLIILDAGHGGEDFGTKAPGCIEKVLNLKTSLALKKLLNERNYRVLMTRQKDQFVSVTDRAAFANEHNPALLVSIHFNSAKAKEAAGIEIFYYSAHEPIRKASSKKLAENVMNQLLVTTKAKSRGVKHGNFCVLRETTMPSILVEGGFMSNEEELVKLKNDQYLQKIVQGIADGIDIYFGNKLAS